MRTMSWGRSGLLCLGKAVAMLLVLIPAGCPTTFGHPADVAATPVRLTRISLPYDLEADHRGARIERKGIRSIF